MYLTYKKFLENNKLTGREDGVATIISVSLKENTCICMNPDRERIKVYIPVLIMDMMNDLCHINNASRLKNWQGWNEKIEYPEDYFRYSNKYIQVLEAA